MVVLILVVRVRLHCFLNGAMYKWQMGCEIGGVQMETAFAVASEKKRKTPQRL